MAALKNAAWMDDGGSWTAQTNGARVTKVTAEDLKLKANEQIGEGKNDPTVSPQSWDNLKARKLTFTGTSGQWPPFYVRMHMLNNRLGGPGDDKANLAPGSTGMNGRHRRAFEANLMKILNGGGSIKKYEITATYNTASKSLTSGGNTDWVNTLAKLDCVADTTAVDGTKKTYSEPIEETADIDTKDNWKGQ